MLKIKKEKTFKISMLLAISSVIVYFLMFSDLNNKSISKPYYPENIVTINSEINGVSLLNFNDSIEILKKTNEKYLIINESYTPSVNGLPISYYQDEHKLKEYSQSNAKNLYLFSKYRNNAVKSAEILRHFTNKKIYIIDYADQSFSNINSNVAINKFKTDYENTASALEQYNVISIVDSKMFNHHLIKDAYILTYIDLIMLSDKKIQSLNNHINKNKKTVISLNMHLSDTETNIVINLISYLLGLKEVSYFVDNSSYSFGRLVNDNAATQASKNSSKIFNAPEMLAFIRAYEKVDFYCFNDDCMKRIPNYNEKIMLNKIDFLELFSMQDGVIKTNLSFFKLNNPIFLISNDPYSEFLISYLIKDLNENGYNFKGIIKGAQSVFSSVYEENGELLLNNDSLYLESLLSESYYYILGDAEIGVSNPVFIFYTILFSALFLAHKTKTYVLFSILFSAPFVFYDSIKFSSELYNQIFISPNLLTFLSLLVLLIDIIRSDYKQYNYKKMVFILLSFSATYYVIPLVLQPPLATMLLCFFSIVLLSFICNIDPINKHKIIGSKYQKTIPFINERKGRVVSPSYRLGRFDFISHSKWIIRNNHLSKYPKSNKEFVCNRSDIKKEIKNRIFDLSTRIENKNIQFWVVPYVNYAKKIIVKSHDTHSPFSFYISVKDKKSDKITTKALHRSENFTGLENKVIRLLNKIEKHYSEPVTVEFGYIRGRLDVLLVEKQNIKSLEFDQVVLRKWREKYKLAKFVENSSISPFSRSVISLFNNYNIIYSDSAIYSFPVKRTRFDINEVYNTVNDLIKIHVNLKELNDKYKIFGITQIIAEKVRPVMNLELSNLPLYGHSELGQIQENLWNHIARNGLVINSYEIKDDWYNGNKKINCSEKEVLDLIVKFSFSIIKVLNDENENKIDPDVSLFSIIDNI